MYRSLRIVAALILTWLTITPACAVLDGETLYSRNCGACHGEDGMGGIGVPLSLPSFQATVDDDYLRRSIRYGRPGRIMPAHTHFSDTEVDAIVKYIREWNRGSAANFPRTPVHGDVPHGKQLYAKHCASCHGENGGGGKGTGITLPRPRTTSIVAPALNNPGFLASATDPMIKNTLMKGREGTPMVSFLKQGLKEKDIDDIVGFVRSFAKSPRAESATLLYTESAVLTVDSTYDMQTTVDNIKRAVANNNYVFIREQTLSYGLVPEDQEDPKQRIVYFCNFHQMNEAIVTDPRVGLFLPCRITVVEQNGKVKMMAINPKRLSAVFNNSELNTMCDEMAKRYMTIMEEAAL
jgi:cytochrome c oxidase cbb3-type subunit 3